MVNLRKKAEADLAKSLEGEWALPVVLVAPDGVKDEVTGQVLYDTVRVNPETGEEIVVNDPVVTLRRSSLARVPVPGETWYVEIPVDPDPAATKESFTLDPSRPPEGGRSLGFIRLYLRRVSQV